jgi:N-carbamoyl-L-amino-acid hydrolase
MTAFDGLWSGIADVGQDPRSGGFRRFPWNDAEMTLREWFGGCAAARGMDTERDDCLAGVAALATVMRHWTAS